MLSQEKSSKPFEALQFDRGTGKSVSKGTGTSATLNSKQDLAPLQSVRSVWLDHDDSTLGIKVSDFRSPVLS